MQVGGVAERAGELEIANVGSANVARSEVEA
jgi:hypothetical protein